MAGEKNDDITESRYRYFIVDTGTFTGGCPDSIMESDYFSGKRGMVLDRGECGPDLLWKNAKGGITAVLSLALGFLITNLLLKNIVARPRPFDSYAQILPLITKPTDYSFPSGHTCASFACALVYLRMMPEKFGVPSVILAGMVAFSRLYLGVHYPGDVLAGFLVAVFTSITACFLVRKYEETKQGQAAGLSGAWKGRK